MNLRHLRHFIAVAEELHFTHAADRLRIAQPALSRSIRMLEEELGVNLLERTQRRVRLTPAGRLYLDRAVRILQDIDRANEDVRRASAGEAGRLSIGFIHSSTYSVTPVILEHYRARYPDVELVLNEFTIWDQLTALKDNVIDVAILRPPVNDTGIDSFTFRSERFLIVVPQSHALARLQSASVSELRDVDWVFFSQQQSPLFHSRIIAMCERAGFAPRVSQYATQIHTVLGLVRAGIGVAVVPSVARNMTIPGIHFLEIEEKPAPVQIALAWRQADNSPTVAAFRQIVSGLVGQKAFGD
jgi:DNA-binding transcriptional LysR family regulator